MYGFNIQPGILTGRGSSHFEFAAGVIYMTDFTGPLGTQMFYPSGILDYRYQKPNGRFIFKIGAGMPELAQHFSDPTYLLKYFTSFAYTTLIHSPFF